MMDDRMLAKRKMYDDLEEYARGKGMERFRPRAVITEKMTVVRPEDEPVGPRREMAPEVATINTDKFTTKSIKPFEIEKLGSAGKTAPPKFKGFMDSGDEEESEPPEAEIEIEGLDPEELTRLLKR